MHIVELIYPFLLTFQTIKTHPLRKKIWQQLGLSWQWAEFVYKSESLNQYMKFGGSPNTHYYLAILKVHSLSVREISQLMSLGSTYTVIQQIFSQMQGLSGSPHKIHCYLILFLISECHLPLPPPSCPSSFTNLVCFIT